MKQRIVIHLVLCVCIFLPFIASGVVVSHSRENAKEQAMEYILSWAGGNVGAIMEMPGLPVSGTDKLQNLCAVNTSQRVPSGFTGIAFYDESETLICANVPAYEKTIMDKWKWNLEAVKKNKKAYIAQVKAGDAWESEAIVFIIPVMEKPGADKNGTIYMAGAIQAPLLVITEQWNLPLFLGLLVIPLIIMEVFAARLIISYMAPRCFMWVTR